MFKELLVSEFGGGCKICGYNKCLAALEFHHRDSETKEHNIGDMITKGYSYESCLKEAKKCDLLCANCHRAKSQKI
jgi:hypothetical protein